MSWSWNLFVHPMVWLWSRSSLIHLACIGVAPPRPLHTQSRGATPMQAKSIKSDLVMVYVIERAYFDNVCDTGTDVYVIFPISIIAKCFCWVWSAIKWHTILTKHLVSRRNVLKLADHQIKLSDFITKYRYNISVKVQILNQHNNGRQKHALYFSFRAMLTQIWMRLHLVSPDGLET